MLTLLIPLAATIVLYFFFRIGYRWRISDIPPTCRKCGYNVSQRPASVETCSECGADLSRPGAIETVRRTSNKWLAIPSGVLFGLTLLMFLNMAVRFPWFSWYLSHAPISWIERNARHDRTVNGDDYRRAWNQRSPDSAYVDHLLDIFEDRSITWRAWMESDLSNAFASKMSEAQRDRLVRAKFGPATIRIRPAVRVGDPLPIAVAMATRSISLPNVFQKLTLAARIDGKAEIGDHFWSRGGIGNSENRALPASAWENVHSSPGPHRVNVKVRRQLLNISSMNGDTKDVTVGPAVDEEATLDVQILPASSAIGAAVPDPSAAGAIASNIDIHAYHWNGGRCFAFIDLLPVNVDRAFAIFLVRDGKREQIGTVSAKAGQPGFGDNNYVPLQDANSTSSIAIELVGSGEGLIESIDQMNYWAGTIAFSAVPLEPFENYGKRSSSAPVPTTLPFQFR